MSRISETPKGVLETYDWQDVAEDLQEQLQEAYKIVEDYERRIKNATNKIDSMFNSGDEGKIIDDLLELNKILNGSENI